MVVYPNSSKSMEQVEKIIIPSLVSEKPSNLEKVEEELKEKRKREEFESFRREYLIKFIPLGFFSRLIVRLVHVGDFEILQSWRNGVHLRSEQKPQSDREEEYSEALITSSSPSNNNFVYKIQVDVVSKGSSNTFAIILQIVDSLIDNFYSRFVFSPLIF